MDYQIFPPEGDIDVRLAMPVSKSQVAREAVIRALCGAEPIPSRDADACDDTRAICRGVTVTEGTVDCGLSATALRLLTAYHAACPGHDVILTGQPALLRRPMRPLIDALTALGARIDADADGSLHVRGTRLSGGALDITTDISSQFVTALMLVAPYMENPLQLTLTGQGVSEQYWRMTAAVMERYGVAPEVTPTAVSVPVGGYDVSTPWRAEGDWSCASYWYMLEAFSMGDIVLEGLDPASPQPDAAAIDIWQRMGINTEPAEDGPGLSLEPTPDQDARLTGDMGSNPDLVPALAVACVCVGIPLHLWGLEHLQYKESDRLECLRQECERLGVSISVNTAQGTVEWDGSRRPVTEMPVFDPHGDHRLAMALAMTAYFIPGIVVRDAQCVSKSYPLYWEHLQKAGFTLRESAK